MAYKLDIRLSGSGGQGLILAGIILANAGIKDGYNAIQSQSYGPEARGGASKAEVIISDQEIYYPKVGKSDVLLAMSQAAYNKYIQDIREESVLIIDSTLVKNIEKHQEEKLYYTSITELAIKGTGREMTANIVALGVIAGITRVVSEEALKEALLEKIPIGTEKLNIKALTLGLEKGAELRIS
jgi:2-oxoglutarate ferredoxin oxidoreductase subunit gamma